MICSNCQQDIPSIAHLCPNCGEPVSEELKATNGQGIEEKLKAAEQEIREELPLIEEPVQAAPAPEGLQMQVQQEQVVGESEQIQAPQFEAPAFAAPETPPAPTPTPDGGISFNVTQETVDQPQVQPAPAPAAPVMPDPNMQAPVAPAAPGASEEEVAKLQGEIDELKTQLDNQQVQPGQAPILLQTTVQGQGTQSAEAVNQAQEGVQIQEASGITDGAAAPKTAEDIQGETLNLDAKEAALGAKKEAEAPKGKKAFALNISRKTLGLIVGSAAMLMLIAGIGMWMLSGGGTQSGGEMAQITSKLDFIPETAEQVILMNSGEAFQGDYSLGEALNTHLSEGISANEPLMQYARDIQRPVALARVPHLGKHLWVIATEQIEVKRAQQELEAWLKMQEGYEKIKLNKQKSYKIDAGLTSVVLTSMNGYILAAQTEEGLLELISRGQSAEYGRVSTLPILSLLKEKGEDAVFTAIYRTNTPGLLSQFTTDLEISEENLMKSKIGSMDFLAISYKNSVNQEVEVETIAYSNSGSSAFIGKGFTPVLVEHMPIDARVVLGGSDLRRLLKDLKKIYPQTYKTLNDPLKNSLNIDLLSDVFDWMTREFILGFTEEGDYYAIAEKTNEEGVQTGLNNMEKVLGSKHLEQVEGTYVLNETVEDSGVITFEWEKVMDEAQFLVSEYRGEAIRFIDIEDTRFFYTDLGDKVAMSNDLEGLQRLIATIKNTSDSLLATEEFQGFVSMLPKEKMLNLYLYADPFVYEMLEAPFPIPAVPQTVKRGMLAAYIASNKQFQWLNIQSSPLLEMHAASDLFEETQEETSLSEETMDSEETQEAEKFEESLPATDLEISTEETLPEGELFPAAKDLLEETMESEETQEAEEVEELLEEETMPAL